MRTRFILPLALLGAVAASAPAPAQENEITGVPTETQRRLAQGEPDIPWFDLLGLVGLVGLLGLRKPHPEDGYHPSPVE